MLATLDYVVLGGYLVLVAAIGLVVGRGQKTTDDYFLGGHRVPWALAGLSIIATETSALTFIGAPVQSLRGDWSYLQLSLGSVAARFVVAGLLIGAYYRARVVTVYGYLGQRFGPITRGSSSALFFVGRSLGSGVRLFGAAIALVVVADVSFPVAIGVIGGVAVLYTMAGGIRSVIWTDALQGVLLFGGGIVAIGFLLADLDASPGELFEQLGAARTPSGHGKLRVFDLSLDPRQAYTLAAGLIGASFLTMATHGTDQDMIQRALTCRGEAGGRRSLWLSAALTLPVAFIFLTVGSLLWLRLGGDAGCAEMAARLAARAGETDPEQGYQFIFPAYVVDRLPAGVRGLIVAGICAAAMSSLDSAISALSTTAVTTVWRPYVAPGRSDAYYLRISRALAVAFGVVLVALALLVWRSHEAGSAREGFGVLMLGLKVLTWIFPPLLGIVLLGVSTRRGNDRGNAAALLVGIGVLLFVEFGWERVLASAPPFAWTWNPLVGCAASFGVAALFRGVDA